MGVILQAKVKIIKMTYVRLSDYCDLYIYTITAITLYVRSLSTLQDQPRARTDKVIWSHDLLLSLSTNWASSVFCKAQEGC